MSESQDRGATGPDRAARRTPYELVFATDALEAGLFPRVQEEARSHGIDPLHLDRFGFLSVAGDALRALVPADAPPEALEQHRALLYHAFNFWSHGQRIYLLDAALARFLVEGAPALADWDLTLPHPSLYLQLPANLFWGSISPESTPEPVDGFFVTAAPAADPLGPEYQKLNVLAVLGIRRDRAGFSVIPFETEAGPGIAAAWLAAPGRGEGADFQNVLPGGELSGLYSILTATEVLKLIARALWYVDRYPEDVSLQEPSGPRRPNGGDAPPPARLPYHRVALGGSREEG